MFFFISFLFLFQEPVIPYKASEEFEVKINLRFKDRPRANEREVWESSEKKVKRGQAPYLTVDIRMLKLSPEEVRVKIFNAATSTVYSKKAATTTIIKLDMGFIEEITQRLTSNEYNVVLYSAQKKAVSRVNIRIDSDGNYYVNDGKYGQF